MPGPVAPIQSCCSEPCEDNPVVQTPGPAGDPGAPGIDGTDGLSPVTTVAAQFLMPAEGANVTVAVGDSTGIVVGSKMFVQTAGTMAVISKPNNISVVLQNLENTASGLYTANAAPTTAIPAGSLMMPTGAQGASGALTGAAGGDLKGTYPNPKLLIPNVKGRIIAGNGTDAVELSAGTNGNVIRYNSATASGLETGAVNLAGGVNHVTGALPILNGGTGQITANLGFNALAPPTTRGDLIYRNATVNARLAIGAASKVLTSNGTDPLWQFLLLTNFDPSVKLLTRYGAIVVQTTIDLNAGVASDTELLFSTNATRIIPRKIFIHDASTNLSGSLARFGIYTAIAKGGQVLVADPNSQLTTLTSADKFADLTLNATMATDIVSVPSSSVWVHLSAEHGSAAFVYVTIVGDDITA